MSLHVVEPGLFSLVVDLGRPRHRSLGVALGGAADVASYTLGNALVGNDSGAAALEITASGPTLRAAVDVACVLFGAPFAMSKRGCSTGVTFTMRQGEELRVYGTHHGMRAYLCVRGGLHLPDILGSRSGLQPIRVGDALACDPSRIGRRRLPDLEDELFAHLNPDLPRRLRVLSGAQADWFPPNGLCERRFTVSTSSNRMGLRLKGEPLPVPPRELVSEPVSPGAVQVTRDGQCIILGVDGQTIGGYPKIAHVISADLDMLGQLRPGENVSFEVVSLEVAQAVWASKQALLTLWKRRCLVSC